VNTTEGLGKGGVVMGSMTAEELIKELERYNPLSRVYIQDGHHFMRKHTVVRVDDEPSTEYATPGKIILVGADTVSRP